MDDGHFHPTSNVDTQPSFREMEEYLSQLRAMIVPGQLTASQIQGLLDNLPRLNEKQIIDLGHEDSVCSICFTSYLALLAEEETALAMDSPAHPVEQLGVTRLSQSWQCGHIFCRRDISKWIQDGHDSCPMCRRLLVESTSNPTRQRDNPTFPADALEGFRRLLGETQASGLPSSDPSINILDQGIFRQVNAQRTNTEDEDDRQEYSGMYS